MKHPQTCFHKEVTIRCGGGGGGGVRPWLENQWKVENLKDAKLSKAVHERNTSPPFSRDDS